ncbi:MAG: hypothetical protein EOP85_21160, partial [Verrucomicrobiaceae bacterium]
MAAETRTQFFETGSPAEPVRLRDGGLLPGITLAYETWGELNADRTNVIFLFHALEINTNPSEVLGNNRRPPYAHLLTDEFRNSCKRIKSNWPRVIHQIQELSHSISPSILFRMIELKP